MLLKRFVQQGPKLFLTDNNHQTLLLDSNVGIRGESLLGKHGFGITTLPTDISKYKFSVADHLQRRSMARMTAYREDNSMISVSLA